MANKSKLFSVLKVLASFAVGVALMIWLFADVQWQEFSAVLAEVHWGWLSVSGIALIISHYLRAFRWYLMLRASGHQTTVWRAFLALLVGYFMNLVVPRLGEISRCGVLTRTDNVPLAVGVGTVVAERVIDLILLGVIVGLTFLLNLGQWDQFSHALLLDKISLPSGSTWLLVLAVGMVAVVGWFAWKRLRKLDNRVINKLNDVAGGLRQGWRTVGQVKSPVTFWLLSLGVWVLYLGMVVSLLHSLPFTGNLGFGASLAILTAGSVAMVAPVQGGIGAYHFLVSRALIVLYAYTELQAEAYSLISHTFITVVTIIIGGLSLTILGGYKRKEHAQPAENSRPDAAAEANGPVAEPGV